MKQVFSAVKAVIQDGDKFLILKQVVNGQMFWDFPGGRIDYGETPFETLKREVKEETRLDIKIVKPLGVCWFFRVADGNQVVCNTFLCKAKNTNVDISNNIDDEHLDDFKWVSKQEFLDGDFKTCHESFDEIIRNLENWRL